LNAAIGSYGSGGASHLDTAQLDHQQQRPVPRGFPLFKCYEWLMSNWFMSKRRPLWLRHTERGSTYRAAEIGAINQFTAFL